MTNTRPKLRRRRAGTQPHRNCAVTPCPMCKCWQPDEAQRLAELAGQVPIREITETLNQEFASRRPPRSYEAVNLAAKKRQIDTVLRPEAGLGLMQMQALFRFDHRKIVEHWVRPGLLSGRQFSPGMRGSYWIFTSADIRQFIIQHSWAYDWTVIAPGPWRTLAEVQARKDGWRTRDELLAYLGYRSATTWPDMVGWVPLQRRRHHSPPHAGTILIRASDFEWIRDQRERQIQQHHQAGLDQRMARGIEHCRPRWERTCITCSARAFGRWDEPPAEICAFCGTRFLLTRPPRGRKTLQARVA